MPGAVNKGDEALTVANAELDARFDESCKAIGNGIDRLKATNAELCEACEAAEFLLAALCVDRNSDTREKLRTAIARARGDQ